MSHAYSSEPSRPYDYGVRRLTPATLLTLALLIAACSGGDDGPPSTPTSAPAGPTLPPIPTQAPRPPATPVAGHPPGTRTGIEVVDRAIEAVETRNPARLAEVLSFHAYRCDNQNVAGSNPCPPGVPEGTPLDVIASGECEARLLSRTDPQLPEALRAFLIGSAPAPLDAGVYAAVEVAPGRISSPLPLRYLVIFVSGHTLLLDDGGVTHLGLPCAGVGPADLFHPADTAVLGPP